MVHPGTRLVIAFSFVIVALSSSLPLQALIVACGWFMALLKAGGNKQSQCRLFLRSWLTAGLFLALIHMLSFEGGLHMDGSGFKGAVAPFLRIGALMASCLWLIATTKPEAFYALLIDLKVPMPAIYLFYKVLYFIPRMAEKGREILEAQQARGFALAGVKNRIKGLLLVLAPLMSSTIYELETSSAAITARGLRSPMPKTHLVDIRFSPADFVLILLSILFVAIAAARKISLW
jgi:energy-coupling factor transport system permease protein